MSFTTDLSRFAQRGAAALDKRVRAITTELFSGVIMGSPVGDRTLWKRHKEHPNWALQPKGYVGGHFRGNWQTTQDAPADGITVRIDPTGAMAIAESTEKMGGAGSRTYLTNNLPYAQRLEYDGWSGQAPEGMVRVNMARVEAILAATKA